jgi:hypothetical protein
VPTTDAAAARSPTPSPPRRLQVYAHVGLSGVVLSSFDPSALAASAAGVADALDATCTAADRDVWTRDDGEATLPARSEFCLATYAGGCFTNATCTRSCFRERHGYSADCALCFGALPQCGVDGGCTLTCLLGPPAACLDCLDPCVDDLYACSALPEVGAARPSGAASADHCHDFDLDAVPTWYAVYDLTFVGTVKGEGIRPAEGRPPLSLRIPPLPHLRPRR